MPIWANKITWDNKKVFENEIDNTAQQQDLDYSPAKISLSSSK